MATHCPCSCTYNEHTFHEHTHIQLPHPYTHRHTHIHRLMLPHAHADMHTFTCSYHTNPYIHRHTHMSSVGTHKTIEIHKNTLIFVDRLKSPPSTYTQVHMHIHKYTHIRPCPYTHVHRYTQILRHSRIRHTYPDLCTRVPHSHTRVHGYMHICTYMHRYTHSLPHPNNPTHS